MKACLHCYKEVNEEFNCCPDCSGQLTVMEDEEAEILGAIHRPVKLVILEDYKEKEQLKALLSANNIAYGTVKIPGYDGGSENGEEEFYVKESRLEDAFSILENFQFRLKELRTFAEAKAKMIKPSLLITLYDELGAEPWELVECLEDCHIPCGCEREEHYLASLATISIGNISGGYAWKSDVYVDEIHLPEAKIAVDHFLARRRYEKDKISSLVTDEEALTTAEGDRKEDIGEEKPVFLGQRFLNWLHKDR